MKSVHEVQFIAALALLAVVGGLLTGQMGWAFFLASLTWIIRQYGEFEKVSNWAKRPVKLPPDLRESWASIAYTPYRQLSRERARSRAMLARVRDIVGITELIPDAVILLDEAGAIETMNSAARSLLRLKKNDVGLGLANIVRSPDFAEFLRSGSDDSPLEFSSPFDPEQQLEARSFYSETQNKLVLVRDITSSNRLMTMRQQFVANVSHELRTPLTVVNGYLETINEDSVTDEERLQVLDKFVAPMSRMQALVEDLLLLTQLESSAPAVEQQAVSGAQIIQGALEEVQSLQTSPDQVAVRIESQREILGSQKELHSVAVNLLGNALRYSGADAIEVAWRDQGDKVRLAVTDNGCGIAEQHIDRLTERFFRIDAPATHARGGTGLGLAIVKHVLKRHNSALQIRSQLNEGSRFYCDFTPLSNKPQTAGGDATG